MGFGGSVMPLSNQPQNSPLGAPHMTQLGALGRYPYDYECYKHGMFFHAEKKWSDHGLTTADWNALVATYRQYDKHGSHYTIACPDFDYSELYPADGDPLPSSNFTFLNVSAAPKGSEIDTGDCGVCPTICYNTTCYVFSDSSDPNVGPYAHDGYWLMSTDCPAAVAAWSIYQGHIIDAIERCSTPFEQTFHISLGITSTDLQTSRYGFFYQLRRYFEYVEGGSGWGGGGWPYGGAWSYGYYYAPTAPEPPFMQTVNALLAAYKIP
jgi:hypothetical protein